MRGGEGSGGMWWAHVKGEEKEGWNGREVYAGWSRRLGVYDYRSLRVTRISDIAEGGIW